MAITKIGTELVKTAAGILIPGGAFRGAASSLALGTTAMDYASGTSSAGGAVGGGVGGTVGSNLLSQALGRFGSLGRVAGMLIGGTAGYSLGSLAGNKLAPIHRRTPKIPQIPGMSQGDPTASPTAKVPGIYETGSGRAHVL